MSDRVLHRFRKNSSEEVRATVVLALRVLVPEPAQRPKVRAA